MDDIMKIIKSFKEFGLMMKGVSKIIKNEGKRTKRWIFRYDVIYIMG